DTGIYQRPVRGLPDQAADGHVAPGGGMVGLTDADDGAPATHGRSPERAQSRLCWRHGPLVAWPTARSARPDMIAWAAAPIRMRPVAMMGSAGSAPPEGLISPT